MWRLGRFRVDDRPFATGATAEVFAARKGRTGQRVAIKLLPLKTYRERAEAEADLATIDHPRLLSVHERVIDERRGVIGLVMDLADGGDLRSALRSGEEPTPSEMLQITDDVLAALEALHSYGLVHRDVKPENVMLERVDGELRARLGDLGIARLVDRTRSTGSVLGTDLYIAPEVHDGQPPSPAADLWAVGYVLYEGLFGAPPHATAATTYQAIGRLRAEGPDRPPNVPDSVWAAVAQLLAARPEDRPSSAAAARLVVASARDAAMTASVGRAIEASTEPRRRRSAGYRRAASMLEPTRTHAWGRGAAVASVVALVGGLAWGPMDLFGGTPSSTGASLAVTPLAPDAADVVPTQYQWRLRHGVLTARLDVTNTSEEPTPATTMPELLPRDAERDGRLPLIDFDGVQERQDDGSVLVRFAVPALKPHVHHLVSFRLALGDGPGSDIERLNALLRGREAAINRHAFNLSDAPTLEQLSVVANASTLDPGDTTTIAVTGTTHDGELAPAHLLQGIRYEVMSGADVIRVDGATLRAIGSGVAVVRAVVGAISGELTLRVREKSAAATPRPTVRPTVRRPASTVTSEAPPPTAPVSNDDFTVPSDNEDVVID